MIKKIQKNCIPSDLLPAKDSKITTPVLIKNTKSICRRSAEDFNPHDKPSFRNNSKVYMMLKHGPLPDGDYSYLIHDGTLTKYAKWLLIAYDLDIPFMALLVLSRIYRRYIDSRRSDNPYFVSDVRREELYGPMGFDFELQSIINFTTLLKKRGYCIIGIWHSLRGIPDMMNFLEVTYDSELKEMYDYFDDIFQSNVNDTF